MLIINKRGKQFWIVTADGEIFISPEDMPTLLAQLNGMIGRNYWKYEKNVIENGVVTEEWRFNGNEFIEPGWQSSRTKNGGTGISSGSTTHHTDEAARNTGQL